MQNELRGTNTALNIEILGINLLGLELSNPEILSISKLPWMQDDSENNVWVNWGVNYRDVIIADPRNRKFITFNLTTYDLEVQSNYDRLKQYFLNAAQFIDSDNDGLLDDWEMLYFGTLAYRAFDDPDEDGQDNATEFAFGTNPHDPNSKASFNLTFSRSPAGLAVTTSFKQRLGNQFSYLLDISDQVQPWTVNSITASPINVITNLYDGTGTGLFNYRLSAPLRAEPSRFIRIRSVPRPH